jgi:hypothetical protein
MTGGFPDHEITFMERSRGILGPPGRGDSRYRHQDSHYYRHHDSHHHYASH